MTSMPWKGIATETAADFQEVTRPLQNLPKIVVEHFISKRSANEMQNLGKDFKRKGAEIRSV